MKSFLFFSILISWLELYSFSNCGMSINLYVYNCRRRKKTLWCPSVTVLLPPFLVERWKKRVLKGRKKWKKCLFTAKFGIFSLMLNHESTFPYLYLDLACKQGNCKQLRFPPRKMYKLWNECTRENSIPIEDSNQYL